MTIFSSQSNVAVLEIVDELQKQRKNSRKHYSEHHRKTILGESWILIRNDDFDFLFRYKKKCIKTKRAMEKDLIYFIIINMFALYFVDDFRRAMMIQRIRRLSSQRRVVRLVVRLMERFRHVRLSNTMPFRAVAKLALLSRHIDSRTEGELMLKMTIF